MGGSIVEAPLARAGVLVVFVATVVAMGITESEAARAGLGALAIAVTGASGLFRATAELARRRSRVPALKQVQEHRRFAVPISVDDAVASAAEELRSAGFVVERIERSCETRVMLASSSGWAFLGTMLVHAGLVALVGALSVEHERSVLALAALLLGAAGAGLRLGFDPRVAWCSAQQTPAGTAVELVLSGRWFPGRVARCADQLARRIETRLEAVR